MLGRKRLSLMIIQHFGMSCYYTCAYTPAHSRRGRALRAGTGLHGHPCEHRGTRAKSKNAAPVSLGQVLYQSSRRAGSAVFEVAPAQWQAGPNSSTGFLGHAGAAHFIKLQRVLLHAACWVAWMTLSVQCARTSFLSCSFTIASWFPGTLHPA